MSKRDANIDLFRIIGTLLVILLHVIGNGGLTQNVSNDNSAYWPVWFLYAIAIGAIDCFALITGYLMIDKSPKAKNFFSLWLQALLYSLTITALFFIFLPECRSTSNLVMAFFPIMTNRWWYVSAYVGLLFFIPILNVAIRRLPKQTLEKFLVIVLLGIGCCNALLPLDPFALRDGCSVAWLAILYCFGAYIRKYDIKRFVSARKGLLGFVGMSLLTWISKVLIHCITKGLLEQPKYDGILFSCMSVTTVIAVIFLMLCCLNLRITPFAEKAIAFFAPTTLSVYLIHVHPQMFEWTLKNAFVGWVEMPTIAIIAGILAATVTIFLVCSAIDWLRILLFRLLRIAKLCEWLDMQTTHLYSKMVRT